MGIGRDGVLTAWRVPLFSIAARLAEDQRAALFPDTDTPFEDEFDVVKRLLPFHIFQQPKEDLETLLRHGHLNHSKKGKRKATEEDLLREEIAGTSCVALT